MTNSYDELFAEAAGLSKLIQHAIDVKRGDKEFMLSCRDTGQWSAEIGNDCHSVCLGEIAGEFEGKGATPELAVVSLINAINTANG